MKLQINLSICYLPAGIDDDRYSSDNSDTDTDIASGIVDLIPNSSVSEYASDHALPEDFLDDIVSLPELGNHSETGIISERISDDIYIPSWQ